MQRSHRRHAKTRPLSRRLIPIVVPVAVLAAAATGVAFWPGGDPSADHDVPVSAPLPDRDDSLPSRDEDRGPLPTISPTVSPAASPTAAPKPKPKPAVTPTPKPTPTPTPKPTVDGHMFVTAALNVRVNPDTDADVLTVLERGAKVALTGATEADWAQILVDGDTYWVSSDYLSETPPPPEEEDDGISQAECESGSEVEDGLMPDAIRVHRAVCAEFPQVESYGGLRSGDSGEHGEGRALDIMVRGALGDEIAEWVRANWQELGVSEVIWAQRIWTVERSDEGWRWMEDRGDDTANHYDHVHVTVYGDEGTV